MIQFCFSLISKLACYLLSTPVSEQKLTFTNQWFLRPPLEIQLRKSPDAMLVLLHNLDSPFRYSLACLPGGTLGREGELTVHIAVLLCSSALTHLHTMIWILSSHPSGAVWEQLAICLTGFTDEFLTTSICLKNYLKITIFSLWKRSRFSRGLNLDT